MGRQAHRSAPSQVRDHDSLRRSIVLAWLIEKEPKPLRRRGSGRRAQQSRSWLVIDSEFQKLLQPLSEVEFEQLEEMLLRDGCRDPLVTWR